MTADIKFCYCGIYAIQSRLFGKGKEAVMDCTEKMAALRAKLPAEEMISQAFSAMAKAYAPYSGFKVGAALLTATLKTRRIPPATVRSGRRSSRRSAKG